MKITGKLAYNQLKNNRIRSLWTIMGIILSTGLITAIFSFAASGNYLVKSILGQDYGQYGATLSGLLTVPIIVLSLIIISMSVIVISNAFRVSAGDRRIQFGILKSIGATKRQILSTVMYESVFLSIIGIPMGVILGLILAFIGINTANLFLSEINSLVNIMMDEFFIVLNFIVSWKLILISSLISFVSILISAWLPGRKASKSSAIDSIKSTDEVKLEEKNIAINPMIEKIFGVEGVLAAKNMKRNKRNLRVSITSITIGVILFINLTSLSYQAKKLEELMYPDLDATVIVDYTSKIVEDDEDINGPLVMRPISNIEADKVTERLNEYGDGSIRGIGSDMITYEALVPSHMLTSNMRESLGISGPGENTLSAEVIILDSKSYEEICQRAGVQLGSTILLNNYSYNDNGSLKNIKVFDSKSERIKLKKFNSEVEEFKIDASLEFEDIPKELLPPNTGTIRLILNQGKARDYMWISDPENIDAYMVYAGGLMDELYPEVKDKEYMELGYTTRIYRIEDYMKIMNIAIVLSMVFVYSFVVLLMLIGFTNVISTMSTNVYVRHREFAVLQSIGMTFKGMVRMIDLESLMISAKALLIGLPLGLVSSYLINRPIKEKFPIAYKFPIVSIFLCGVFVFTMTFIIMRHAIKKVKKNNIIETIRQ